MPSLPGTPTPSGRNTPRARSRSPFGRWGVSDETVVDIVNNAKQTLEMSKDLLDLAPVPGLSGVIGALVTVLEQVEVTDRSYPGYYSYT